MVGTFKRNKFIDFILSLQRHPLFFERTTTLVTTQEKHGSDVKASGWYNLGEWWSWWEEDEDEDKLEDKDKEADKDKDKDDYNNSGDNQGEEWIRHQSIRMVQ